MFKQVLCAILFIAIALFVLTYAPDIKGAGASEQAFVYQDKDGTKINVPYALTNHPIVIHGGSRPMLINPSPQRQWLRITGPEGQYHIRYRMSIHMPTRTAFTIETVSLRDSTVTSRFEAQTI